MGIFHMNTPDINPCTIKPGLCSNWVTEKLELQISAEWDKLLRAYIQILTFKKTLQCQMYSVDFI